MKLFDTALMLFLAVFTVLLFVVHQDFIYDDAYISFRYAENLAQGKGIVFNEGEYVEGISNLLWVMILAFIKKIVPAVDIVQLSRYLGFVFFLASLYLTVLLCKTIHRIEHTPVNKGLLGICLYLSTAVPAFFLWSISGLENSLYAFMLLCFYILLLRKRHIASAICLFLASATRPEAPLFAAVPLFFFATGRQVNLFNFKISLPVISRNRIKSFLSFCVAFAGCMLCFTAWRYAYFGDIVPNTYYIKSGGDFLEVYYAGQRYLLSFFDQHTVFCSAFLCLLPCMFTGGNNKIAGSLSCLLLLQTLLILNVGGDWMLHYRFIASFIPFMALSIWYALNRISGTQRLGILVASLVFYYLCMTEADKIYGIEHSYSESLTKSSVALGQWLEQNSPDNSTLAVGDCGAIPYFSGLRTIDLHGLMDRHIGKISGSFSVAPHSIIDLDYVLNKSPDWFVVLAQSAYVPGGIATGRYPLYDTVLGDKRFLAEYQFLKEYMFNPLYYYHLYFRKRAVPNITIAADMLVSEGETAEVYINCDSAAPASSKIIQNRRVEYVFPYIFKSWPSSIAHIRFDPTSSAEATVKIYSITCEFNGKKKIYTPADIRNFQRSSLECIDTTQTAIILKSNDNDPILRLPVPVE